VATRLAFANPRAVDGLGEGEVEGLQDLPAYEKVVARPSNLWVEGEGFPEEVVACPSNLWVEGDGFPEEVVARPSNSWVEGDGFPEEVVVRSANSWVEGHSVQDLGL